MLVREILENVESDFSGSDMAQNASDSGVSIVGEFGNPVLRARVLASLSVSCKRV